MKKFGIKVNKDKLLTGAWNSKENYVYLKFMAQNAEDFKTETNRRKSKVFFRLSKILKKRTPDQCRSHHQKLQLKYNDNLALIMKEVQTKVHRAIAEDYVNRQNELQRESFQQFLQQQSQL